MANKVSFLEGICEVCGARLQLPVPLWAAARAREAWPACKRCGEWVFPTKRKCKTCGAVLRSGNFEAHCTPCYRRIRKVLNQGAAHE